MINISQSARSKIEELIKEEGDPSLCLRTFVQGGGCSGMQYGFTFDKDQNEDDFEIPIGITKILVDAMSMQYLTGAEIDYKSGLEGENFVIKNPNAQTTCGCGSSFSMGDDFYDNLD
jgi:iron-sulfur cluster insertion protein